MQQELHCATGNVKKNCDACFIFCVEEYKVHEYYVCKYKWNCRNVVNVWENEIKFFQKKKIKY